MLINESIGLSPNINWVATAWTLSNSTGYLLFGRLSDIFGRRWLTVAAISLSLVACIIAVTAHYVNALIAANTLSGIAAAVQLSFPILLGELVANRHRGPIASIVFLTCTPFNVFGRPLRPSSSSTPNKGGGGASISAPSCLPSQSFSWCFVIICLGTPSFTSMENPSGNKSKSSTMAVCSSPWPTLLFSLLAFPGADKATPGTVSEWSVPLLSEVWLSLRSVSTVCASGPLPPPSTQPQPRY